MKTPLLKKLDLRKITRKDGLIEHPDIKLNCQYLIKFQNYYLAGKFYKEYSGLYFFDGDYNIGLNNRNIIGIWQIKSQ